METSLNSEYFFTTVKISSAVYTLPENYINIQMCTYILSQFSSLGTHFLSASPLQVLLTAKSNMPLAKKERSNGILVSKVLPSHIQHIFYFPPLQQSTNRTFSFQFFTRFLCVNLTEIGKLSVTKLSVNLV